MGPVPVHQILKGTIGLMEDLCQAGNTFGVYGF